MNGYTKAGLIESLLISGIMCHRRPRILKFQPDTKKLVWIGGENGCLFFLFATIFNKYSNYLMLFQKKLLIVKNLKFLLENI